MINALSIDLEDWFCAYNLRISAADWGRQDLRVQRNTERILDLLARYNTRATVFVLGWIAERVPELVSLIEKQGHEIATHGYSHTVLTAMTPEMFEQDLRHALDVTSACIHQPIRGFRAPSFTITSKTMWAFEIMEKHGIKYDSSIFPISHHPDYGVPDAPLSIHLRGAITEAPLSVAEIMGQRIPCSGGGYFRVFPYPVSRFLINQCNKQGRPAVFYMHPWEIDADQPRVKLAPMKAFRHYWNLDKTMDRLEHLLQDFEFRPLCDILGLEVNGGAK